MGRSFEYGLEIDRVGCPFSNQPPRRVSDRIHMRILYGANDARSHFSLRLIEARVYRRNNPVELSQNIIGKIERAVALDINFAAGQDPDSVDTPFERPYLRHLLEKPFMKRPARLGRTSEARSARSRP